MSWHQGKHIIAFVSGASQVTIRDYEDKGLCYFLSISLLASSAHVLENNVLAV